MEDQIVGTKAGDVLLCIETLKRVVEVIGQIDLIQPGADHRDGGRTGGRANSAVRVATRAGEVRQPDTSAAATRARSAEEALVATAAPVAPEMRVPELPAWAGSQ